MARRHGYLTAGGRPGDLAEAFLTARSHYRYFETTAPQSATTLARIRRLIPDVVTFFYTDVFYPAWRGYPNVTTWPAGMECRPTKEHPAYVRDLAGNIIPRFGKGLFIPRQSTLTKIDATLGPDPIRIIAACHRKMADLMGSHVRCDNLSPTIGWDLAGHKRVLWYGEERTREEIGEAYKVAAKRAVYAMTAALGKWGLVASSGERWSNTVSSVLMGRLQERGIVATSFANQPLREGEKFNLALCYPDTVDSVCATFANPRLQPSVVVVEHHDLGGKVLGI